jgi:hypothetical protein
MYHHIWWVIVVVHANLCEPHEWKRYNVCTGSLIARYKWLLFYLCPLPLYQDKRVHCHLESPRRHVCLSSSTSVRTASTLNMGILKNKCFFKLTHNHLHIYQGKWFGLGYFMTTQLLDMSKILRAMTVEVLIKLNDHPARKRSVLPATDLVL